MLIVGRNLALSQASPHCVSAESELLAHLQRRKSGLIEAYHRINGLGRRGLETHRNTSLLEP